MNGLVPTFGIEQYAEQVAWLLTAAPRQMALVEAVCLGGIGAAAAVLIGLAMFRRSALSAVGFSFVALTGLVLGMLLGRLDFLSGGVQVLIVCLHACSVLLFLTATVRIARDNAVVGLLTLVLIVALVGAGGGAVLGVVDGWPLAQLAVAVTVGLTILLVMIEVFRGDRGTIVVAPGLLLAAASLPAMAFAVSRGATEEWVMGAAPLILLTVGALLAAGAAQLVSPGHAGASAPKPRRRAPKAAAPFSPTAVSSGPMFSEVGDDPHHGEVAAPPSQQAVERPLRPVTTPAPRGGYDDRDERRGGGRARDLDLPAARPRQEFGAAVEPVSAQWGSSAGPRRTGRERALGAGDYVWDMMAEREVRMGDEFAAAFGVSGGRMASPDVLRDAVAPESLDAFDDAILGGGDPAAGRFDVELLTVDGQVVRLEGRRQVDHEGLMVRLEARLAEPVSPPPGRRRGPSAADTPRPSFAAPRREQQAPVRDEAPLAASVPAMVGMGADGAAAALDRGDVGAVLSPVIRLADRHLVGFDVRAAIDTGRGQPMLEGDLAGDLAAAGYGRDLARVVVPQAAQELAQWIAADPDQGQFVTIDIAAGGIDPQDVTDAVSAAAQQFGAPAGAMVVSFDEARIKADSSRATQTAKALRKAGASLALDGFGMSSTPLGKFSKFSFDMVKLDPRFVASLADKKKSRQLLKQFISAAHKSGAAVVACGVGDEDTAAILHEAGCDFASGPLFGDPHRAGSGPVRGPSRDPQRGYGGGGGYDHGGYGGGSEMAGGPVSDLR